MNVKDQNSPLSVYLSGKVSTFQEGSFLTLLNPSRPSETPKIITSLKGSAVVRNSNLSPVTDSSTPKPNHWATGGLSPLLPDGVSRALPEWDKFCAHLPRQQLLVFLTFWNIAIDRVVTSPFLSKQLPATSPQVAKVADCSLFWFAVGAEQKVLTDLHLCLYLQWHVYIYL